MAKAVAVRPVSKVGSSVGGQGLELHSGNEDGQHRLGRAVLADEAGHLVVVAGPAKVNGSA